MARNLKLAPSPNLPLQRGRPNNRTYPPNLYPFQRNKSRNMARRRDTWDQTLRLLQGPGENDSFHLKNGTDCVCANAKKKKKTYDIPFWLVTLNLMGVMFVCFVHRLFTPASTPKGVDFCEHGHLYSRLKGSRAPSSRRIIIADTLQTFPCRHVDRAWLPMWRDEKWACMQKSTPSEVITGVNSLRTKWTNWKPV